MTRTFNALMSGNRTSLIRFNKINDPGFEGGSLDSKLFEPQIVSKREPILAESLEQNLLGLMVIV